MNEVHEDEAEAQHGFGRYAVVEVFMSNPSDWDEVQEDYFDLNNPIIFHDNKQGWSTYGNFL